ncbi:MULTISPECIES: TetR/AcrR family transcriptional regulator [Erwinia]|uniref:TetR/AcrR family transcriptional regulator n=1 Tax=Erwinia TaxID=551 RepID=UPI00055459F0|nr:MULTISPECIES: TetR/AcrR family transcriptional regulator [Erwinia]MCJ7927918.1 TetR/AcrR family transcriptional regulator [Pantoea vagans]
MSEKITHARARRPRADGERNRFKLIAAAKVCFETQGAAARLEQIARDAGVGIGTLYRHFPTRDDLIQAVYLQETIRLNDAAAELVRIRPPIDALRAWLYLFIDFLETKQNIGDVLDTLIGGPEELYGATPASLSPSVTMLVEAVNRERESKIVIAPLDLLRAIAGVATIRPDLMWKEHCVALVGLLLKDSSV